MIYRSNLQAPDLQPYFKHVHCRPMPHSFGHDVLSDFADRPADDPVFGLYKNCGFWTHDEAAILYNVAKQIGGAWCDIGCHTGWTSAHIACNGLDTMLVDPMLRVDEFRARMAENIDFAWRERGWRSADIYGLSVETSNEFFKILQAHHPDRRFAGIVIDGDHCAPCPLQDAQNAAKYLKDRGVILFHDAIGGPVQQGVYWLIDRGFKCKIYSTPHVVACCWRGDFTPPNHIPDPRVKHSVRGYLNGLARYAD